jgi:hypothetical protein
MLDCSVTGTKGMGILMNALTAISAAKTPHRAVLTAELGLRRGVEGDGLLILFSDISVSPLYMFVMLIIDIAKFWAGSPIGCKATCTGHS